MPIRRFDIEPLLPLLQQGFTLLAPNNRSVDGILREYASHVTTVSNATAAWRRPSVFAIDIYIQKLWQLAASQGIAPFHTTLLLSRFDEQELWLQIVRSSIDDFPLLNSEETASSAARSYQFYKQWNVADSDSIKRYNGAVDFQTFLGWSAQFEALCRKTGVASLSDAGRLLALNVDSLRALLPEKIALVNFDQPPPLYAELFAALATTCEFEWRQEPAIEDDLLAAFSHSETVERKFSNSRDEIDACLSWSRDRSQRYPGSHIGIVIDHGRALEPLIEEALVKASVDSGVDGFAIGSSMNRLRSQRKLSELADFDNALAILGLNHELIDSERFCRLLQSPHTAGSEQEYAARLAFEAYFRRHGEAEIRLSRLRQMLLRSERDYSCPILAAALLEFSELARREPSHQPLRQWLQLFDRQLQTLGWSQAHTTKAKQRLTRQWQQCIQRLASSSAVLGNISLISALGKLQTFLTQSNVDLRFDDRLQISLVDIEEAQDLLFDHVWLLGVDDRSWPLPVNPVAFLPYTLQQELGMPATTNQQQLDTAVSQLRTLRKQTRSEMVISYHVLEEELSIRPSALLRDIPFTPPAGEPAFANETSKPKTSSRLERFEDSLHIPLLPEEEISGGTSLLSHQSNCPFRAFARNRLDATGLEEFSHGLTPLVRGNALHKALEKIGREIRNAENLHSLTVSDRERLVQESAATAIDYLRQYHPETMTPSFAEIEQHRLGQLIEGFLQLELQRSGFTILHNEEAVSWRHASLTLNLRIDRIDRLQDGSLALIDYKTGRQTNYRWFDTRPDDMQLPLYQIAIADADAQDVGATLICQLNAENIGFIGPMEPPDFGASIKVSGQAKHFEGGWRELQGFWNETIYSLVEEFEAGLLAVAPTRGYATCQYCDLDPLCRIAETIPGSMEPGEDAA